MNRHLIAYLRRLMAFPSPTRALSPRLPMGSAAMGEDYKLEHRNGKWHVLALRAVGTAAEAAWVSLGGCPAAKTVAVRLWLALLAQRRR